MNICSLPVETLEAIIKAFISNYREEDLDNVECKFVPYWQHNLTPLLRVCKSWHGVSERLLYERVSVGKNIPQTIPRRSHEFSRTRRGNIETYAVLVPLGSGPPRRRGEEIVEQLQVTLSTNARIAELLKDLQISIARTPGGGSLELARKCTLMLQAYPNVQGIDLHNFHPSEIDALTEALKAKPLVRLYLTLTGNGHQSAYRPFRLLELMQGWPRLRTIVVDASYASHRSLGSGMQPLAEWNGPDALDAPGVSSCCPDLIIIHLKGFTLSHGILESLRVMASKVEYLNIQTESWSSDPVQLDALCRCIHAWSATLEHLHLYSKKGRSPYRPFGEAVSTLERLQTLEINISFLDYGVISDLPKLTLLRFLSDWMVSDPDISAFVRLLDDKEKFLSLKRIKGPMELGENDKLGGICSARNIYLDIENY